MNDSDENKETSTVRSLFCDVEYLPRGGLKIYEVPFCGMYRYIFLYPKKILNGKGVGALSEVLAKALLPQMLSKVDIKERYTKRESLTFSESGDANLSVFKAEQKGKDIVLSSSMLGIDVSVLDTGMNFVFCLSAQKTEQLHQEAEAILRQGGNWLKRLKEICIDVVDPYFVGQNFENEYFYGYSPTNIYKELLKYVPITDLQIVDPEDIMKSFKSEENLGVKICSVFRTPVYFRLTLPTKDGVDNLTFRRAHAILVEQDKIFMRSTGIVAEFVVRSVARSYDNEPDESFDYVNEQEKMKEVAKTIYLGLWQYVNNRGNTRS